MTQPNQAAGRSNPRAVLPQERASVIGWFVALGVLLALVVVVGMLVGSYPVGLPNLGAWLSGRADETLGQILGQVRFPRILLTVVVGAALGLAGPLLQSSFRTALADSYLLGLAGFGALGAVLFQDLGYGGFGTPILASFGALEAAWLVGFLSRESSSERRALVGVALAAVSLAGLALLLSLSASPSSANVIGWVVGGFYAQGWPQLWAMLWLAIPAIIAGLLMGRVANLVQLGDDVAENLGLNARASRTGLVALAAILTGVAVGTSGLLGFVGLLSAGLARGIFGTDYRRLLPGACLIGAVAVALSDLLGRTLLAPNEIPAGAFTTLMGGVWLAVLSRRAL
jgi:iron complex transport system permease protein